jgi:YD repeat-containing protein
MHSFTNQTRRGFVEAAAMSAILLTFIGILHADDKSPKQVLAGKPAATSSGSGRYYDGHGAFAGRNSASGSTTRLYDRQGRTTGRVDASKDSTRVYDRSGSFSGRSTRSGEGTRFYDRKGSFNGRSTTSGTTTRFSTTTELILGGRKLRAERQSITIRLGNMSAAKRSRCVARGHAGRIAAWKGSTWEVHHVSRIKADHSVCESVKSVQLGEQIYLN